MANDSTARAIAIAALSNGGGAVESVNGKTGVVVLDAEDVHALPEDTELFSGDYDDLTNKPELFSGDYNDLTNKPTIPVVPTNVSEFTNDAGYVTSSYHDSSKQDVLTAGTNITITNNVISATDTTYTAGTNISIDSNNVISATGGSEVSVSATGTSTDEVHYITVDGDEYKLPSGGGSDEGLVHTETSSDARIMFYRVSNIEWNPEFESMQTLALLDNMLDAYATVSLTLKFYIDSTEYSFDFSFRGYWSNQHFGNGEFVGERPEILREMNLRPGTQRSGKYITYGSIRFYDVAQYPLADIKNVRLYVHVDNPVEYTVKEWFDTTRFPANSNTSNLIISDNYINAPTITASSPLSVYQNNVSLSLMDGQFFTTPRGLCVFKDSADYILSPSKPVPTETDSIYEIPTYAFRDYVWNLKKDLRVTSIQFGDSTGYGSIIKQLRYSESEGNNILTQRYYASTTDSNPWYYDFKKITNTNTGVITYDYKARLRGNDWGNCNIKGTIPKLHPLCYVEDSYNINSYSCLGYDNYNYDKLKLQSGQVSLDVTDESELPLVSELEFAEYYGKTICRPEELNYLLISGSYDTLESQSIYLGISCGKNDLVLEESMVEGAPSVKITSSKFAPVFDYIRIHAGRVYMKTSENISAVRLSDFEIQARFSFIDHNYSLKIGNTTLSEAQLQQLLALISN